MTKKSDHTDSDSEQGSVRSVRVKKLSAILCPTVCALLLVCIFTVSFLGTKMAYEQYDAFCNRRRFNVAKLYFFPNNTYLKINTTAIQ